MLKRYAIWNREDAVITPIGEVLSAEQWMNRYPVTKVPTIVPVVAAGEINGAYFGTLGQMVQMFEGMGADFSACTTNEEKLEVIEAFEDAMNTPSNEPSPEERQASALEAIASGATAESTAAMNALLMGEE